MVIKSKEHYYYNGLEYIILEFDDGYILTLTLDECKEKYPELFDEIGNRNTSNNSGEVPGIVIILGFLVVFLIIYFWTPISSFLMILPYIIGVIEIAFTFYVISKQIAKGMSFNLDSLISGLTGGIAGFGIAIVVLLLYLIPLSFFGRIDTWNNELDNQLKFFFYSTIICFVIYSTCTKEKFTPKNSGGLYICALIGAVLIFWGSR